MIDGMLGYLPLKLANRNTSTVNGKPLKQVEGEIFEYLNDMVIEKGHKGKPFVNIDNLTDRLTEIVGPFGFTIVPIPLGCQEFSYMAYPNAVALEERCVKERKSVPEREKEPHQWTDRMERVITALIIYNDDGEAVIVKYGYGGETYKLDTATGHITELKNVPQSTFSDGSKRAIHALGIAEKQLREKKKTTAGENRKANSGQNNVQNYRVVLQKSFSGKNNGYYTAPIVDKDTGEVLELFLGKDAADISESKKSKLLSSPPGKEFTAIGYKSTFNGKVQIRLCDVTN